MSGLSHADRLARVSALLADSPLFRVRDLQADLERLVGMAIIHVARVEENDREHNVKQMDAFLLLAGEMATSLSLLKHGIRALKEG